MDPGSMVEREGENIMMMNDEGGMLDAIVAEAAIHFSNEAAALAAHVPSVVWIAIFTTLFLVLLAAIYFREELGDFYAMGATHTDKSQAK